MYRVTESVRLLQTHPAAFASVATELLTAVATFLNVESHKLGKPVAITSSTVSVDGDTLTVALDFRPSEGSGEQFLNEAADGTVEEIPSGGDSSAATENRLKIIIRDQLANRFDHHAPKGDQAERYGLVRQVIKNAALVCVDITPCTTEQTRALNALDEAMFLFNAAIARHG